MDARGDSWTAYSLWCLAGLGVLSILTIGPFVLLLTLALCGWLLWRLEFGWGMLGLLSGAALPVLYVAWLNRDGPGTVCSVIPTLMVFLIRPAELHPDPDVVVVGLDERGLLQRCPAG